MTDKQRTEALEALQLLDGTVAQATGLNREGVVRLMNATATIQKALSDGASPPQEPPMIAQKDIVPAKKSRAGRG